MNHHNNSIQFLKANVPPDLCHMSELYPRQPFSDDVILFLNALSKEINRDPRSRQYPDVATFAFFCRKSNINQLKKQYFNKETIRLGRGLAFHVAPSNVPVNFAYSLLTGMLAGTSNIVKVPSKYFEQIDVIAEAIHRIYEVQLYPDVSKRIKLVRYDRSDDTVTEKLSEICDVRIIWGGDETINKIRKHPIPPRSFDITFPDRYSFCVINADEFVKEGKPEKVAEGFYNDTYLFDQNACTSPHLVIWLGSKDNVEKSKKIFWSNLHKIAKQKYVFSSIRAVDKLTALCDHSINNNDISKVISKDNLLWRIELKGLEKGVENFHSNCGYFLEYYAKSFGQVIAIVNQRYQTMSYYGVHENDLKRLISIGKPKGIDRVVPVGRTMDFDLTWDGYGLVSHLSRVINIID